MKRALLSLAVFALLAGLGAWQVQRLAWKEALLASIRENQTKPPLRTLPTLADEHRRVALSGHFAGKSFFIGPRVQEGVSGYHLVAPFKTAGGTVFVDRGWVAGKDAALKNETMLRGTVRLPHPGYFTPVNDPAKDQWYWVEPAAMAQDSGASAAFVVEGETDETRDIRNDHKQYAAFWFTMAALSQLVFYLRFRKA